MRCSQCSSSFRIAHPILPCGECKEQFCTKCMKKVNGIYYCHKCTVLIMRPPDINELMKLRAKDLQDYLSRHSIPTFGLVEKRELVDLLCSRNVPVKNTKTSAVLNKILSNFETVFFNGRNSHEESRVTSPTSSSPPRFVNAARSTFFPSTSSVNLHTNTSSPSEPDRTSSHTLPKETRQSFQPEVPRAESPTIPFPTTSGTVNIGLEPEHISSESSPNPSPLPRRYPKLSDYESVEDINSVSSKELKTLLTLNRVDYKGCVEKSELIEKAKILWTDNKLKAADLPQNLEDLCKLCMDAPLDCVLLECGHIATCINCGKVLAECPICRQYVSRVVRTFKA